MSIRSTWRSSPRPSAPGPPGIWFRAELNEPPKTRFDDEPYAASASDLLDIVRGLDEEIGTVVLVAHNPGLEDFAETLTGEIVPMPTSALAVIELNSTWVDAGGAVGWLRAAGRPPSST